MHSAKGDGAIEDKTLLTGIPIFEVLLFVGGILKSRTAQRNIVHQLLNDQTLLIEKKRERFIELKYQQQNRRHQYITNLISE